MKTTLKKIPRYFKIDARIEGELRERSRMTGVSQTRIVEDALGDWFNAGQKKRLAQTASRLKAWGDPTSTGLMLPIYDHPLELAKNSLSQVCHVSSQGNVNVSVANQGETSGATFCNHAKAGHKQNNGGKAFLRVKAALLEIVRPLSAPVFQGA